MGTDPGTSPGLSSIHDPCIGERNGNPLQCSCLENQGQGSLWAPVFGVAQSQARLKRLSSSSSMIWTILWEGGGAGGSCLPLSLPALPLGAEGTKEIYLGPGWLPGVSG